LARIVDSNEDIAPRWTIRHGDNIFRELDLALSAVDIDYRFELEVGAFWKGE
jgi:hypothetical protein